MRGCCGGGRCLALVARASHELRGPLTAALLGAARARSDAGDGARCGGRGRAAPRGAALEDLRRPRAGGRGARRRRGRARRAARGRGASPGSCWRAHRGCGSSSSRRPVRGRARRPVRLAQALANLVANAVEHGGRRGRRPRPRARGGHVRVEVADGGPGLPAPVAELVAAAPRPPRAAAAAASRSRPGSPRRHGGRLVTAPSPRGARLVLELPGSPARAAGRAPRARRRGRHAPLDPPSAAGRPPGGGRAVSRRRRAALLLGLALVLGGLAASDVARREAALRAELAPLVDVRRRPRRPRAGQRVRRARPRAAARARSASRRPARPASRPAARRPPARGARSRRAGPSGRCCSSRPARRRAPVSAAASARPRSSRPPRPAPSSAGARVDVLVTRDAARARAGRRSRCRTSRCSRRAGRRPATGSEGRPHGRGDAAGHVAPGRLPRGCAVVRPRAASAAPGAGRPRPRRRPVGRRMSRTLRLFSTSAPIVAPMTPKAKSTALDPQRRRRALLHRGTRSAARAAAAAPTPSRGSAKSSSTATARPGAGFGPAGFGRGGPGHRGGPGFGPALDELGEGARRVHLRPAAGASRRRVMTSGRPAVIARTT